MDFLSSFIPLLGSFLPGFFDLFFIPLFCLSFLATIPCILRYIFQR